LKEISTLEETIGSLENKSPEHTEDALLTIANALQDNASDMDEETLKEFNQIVHIVEVAEDMKGLMRQGDFEAIANSLTKLVVEQRGLYNEY